MTRWFASVSSYETASRYSRAPGSLADGYLFVCKALAYTDSRAARKVDPKSILRVQYGQDAWCLRLIVVSHAWDASVYQANYSFVFDYGRDVLGLLNPQAGERILDVGCGTGQLTAEIARAGATVTGVDLSPEMIAEARRNFPGTRFAVHDVCDLPFEGEFDAVFSNAALHWVTRAEEAVISIAGAVRPGGRFVAEMGGRGNIRALLDASDRALRELGVDRPERFHPWYYPGIGEYASLLERHSLEVTFATLFDRPTPLEGGDEALPNWFRMFGARLTEALAPERMAEYHTLVREFARPELLKPEGWVADYRRLRIAAHKIG